MNSSKYEPKVGDRVRFTDTFEATIEAIDTDGGIRTSTGSWYEPAGPMGEWTRTIEKLADPEPEWVDGDVVIAGGFTSAHRLGGEWLKPDGGVHYLGYYPDALTQAWKAGRLKILFKADGQKEVA